MIITYKQVLPLMQCTLLDNLKFHGCETFCISIDTPIIFHVKLSRSDIELLQIYLILRKTTISTESQIFQYKILSNTLYLNSRLCNMGTVRRATVIDLLNFGLLFSASYLMQTRNGVTFFKF